MNYTRGNKGIFSGLPTRDKMSKKEGIENFGANIKNIYSPDVEPELYKIAKTIYDKLDTKDPDWSWDLQTYGKFRLLFSKIRFTEFDVLSTSIQKCLDATTSEILLQLQMFSQECGWYQLEINKKEQIPNSNKSKTRGIHSIDCFWIIIALQSYMYKNIKDYADNIIRKYYEEKSLDEILAEIDLETQKKVLKKLENEFQFVEKYSLFKDVYKRIYEKSIEKLRSFITEVYGVKQMNEVKRNSCSTASPRAKRLGLCQRYNDRKKGDT